MAALAVMSTRRELPQSPYLAAATGRTPDRTPVWMMRQAGRSLPEYRAIRATHTMLSACFNPELVCEITMQPVRRHGVDAAILFSDIVVPLKAAGIDLDIVPDVGPVIAEPIRTAADVTSLTPLDRDAVAPVADAIALLTAALPRSFRSSPKRRLRGREAMRAHCSDVAFGPAGHQADGSSSRCR